MSRMLHQSDAAQLGTRPGTTPFFVVRPSRLHGKRCGPQKIRTAFSVVRKSYGDMYIRILLAGSMLRRRAAANTPPTGRRGLERIFHHALKSGSLGSLGDRRLGRRYWPFATGKLIVKEQILPAHAPQRRRCSGMWTQVYTIRGRLSRFCSEPGFVQSHSTNVQSTEYGVRRWAAAAHAAPYIVLRFRSNCGIDTGRVLGIRVWGLGIGG
jgi:hypothetical protein